MLKVTCIIGSPHTNGSCAYLVDKFIDGIGTSTAVVKRYCVSEIEMNYCYGCKKCYASGECVQNDDVKNVVFDILSSDYVIIAAPSWWADVPAQLKTLFDRTTPYGDTNPNRKYKADKPVKGIAIAVRAGVRQQENELILNSIQHYFGHLGIETVERISVCQTDTLNDLLKSRQNEIQQVFELGKRIGEVNDR
ncbi:MAG: flavodoxin family protein [Clostridia bacterium]|nr:flavodoxin family protein [Clostridia bacterium]